MKLDKKQLPQLAVLGLLVVACVGVVAFQFAGPRRSAPPAPIVNDRSRAPDRASEEAAGPRSARVASADLGAVPASVFPSLMSTPARRDPFRPSTLPGAVEISTRPPAGRQNGRATTAGGLAKNPLPFNPFRDISQGSGPAALTQGQVAQVLPEPDPEFTLTGVIRGHSNVAIIRTGEGGRHIVKQGQFIDGRYRVVSVTENGAVLAHNNRRIYVKLGGVKNER